MNSIDSRQFLVTTWSQARERLERTVGRPCLIGQSKAVTILTFDYPPEHRSTISASEHRRFERLGLSDRSVRFSADAGSHGRIVFARKSKPSDARTFRFVVGTDPDVVAHCGGIPRWGFSPRVSQRNASS